MAEPSLPSRAEKPGAVSQRSGVGNGKVFAAIPLVFLLAVGSAFASEGTYTGALSCQSSSCHGGAPPKNNQNLIWNQFDFHSRAYAILATSRSTRIAESLKIQSAAESARCTICHSPFQVVRSDQLAKTAHTDEGVSCESCHGAASSWLRSHTRKDFTHQDRVNDGMRELKGFYAKANTCVACHEVIDPAILDAGHPPLVFELDSQLVSEPPHWTEGDSWAGPRAWLTGQAVALREQSWKLAKNEGSADRWKALLWLLGEVSRNGMGIPVPMGGFGASGTPGKNGGLLVSRDFQSCQHFADNYARSAQSIQWGGAECAKLLKGLAGVDTATASDLPEKVSRAEVLVQALDRLAVALKKNGRSIEGLDSALTVLFGDVRDPHAFDPIQFAQHLKTLDNLIPKEPK